MNHGHRHCHEFVDSSQVGHEVSLFKYMFILIDQGTHLHRIHRKTAEAETIKITSGNRTEKARKESESNMEGKGKEFESEREKAANDHLDLP